MDVQAHHWALWAVLNREAARGNLGYPGSVNFYTPARREDESSSSRLHYTQDDMDAAELIARAVARAEETERTALTENFGAYPGAPAERKRRLAIAARKLNRSRSEVENIARAGRRFVEGVIVGWQSQ